MRHKQPVNFTNELWCAMLTRKVPHKLVLCHLCPLSLFKYTGSSTPKYYSAVHLQQYHMWLYVPKQHISMWSSQCIINATIKIPCLKKPLLFWRTCEEMGASSQCQQFKWCTRHDSFNENKGNCLITGTRMTFHIFSVLFSTCAYLSTTLSSYWICILLSKFI